MVKEAKPLIEIISEEDFLPLVQETCVEFFRTLNAFVSALQNHPDVTGKFYSILIQETEFVESFLDEHGARENKTWSLFTEYIASIRNLALAAFYINHLRDRYSFYKLRDNEDDANKFFLDGKRVLLFLNNSILRLYHESKNEAMENRLVFPHGSVDPKEFSEIEVNKYLPRTAAEEKVNEEEERIIQIFERMRSVSKLMRELKISQTGDVGKIKEIVHSKLDSRKILMFKNMVHIAQSEFDTYIKNTMVEHKHKSIKGFRGIS